MSRAKVTPPSDQGCHRQNLKTGRTSSDKTRAKIYKNRANSKTGQRPPKTGQMPGFPSKITPLINFEKVTYFEKSYGPYQMQLTLTVKVLWQFVHNTLLLTYYTNSLIRLDLNWASLSLVMFCVFFTFTLWEGRPTEHRPTDKGGRKGKEIIVTKGTDQWGGGRWSNRTNNTEGSFDQPPFRSLLNENLANPLLSLQSSSSSDCLASHSPNVLSAFSPSPAFPPSLFSAFLHLLVCKWTPTTFLHNWLCSQCVFEGWPSFPLHFRRNSLFSDKFF